MEIKIIHQIVAIKAEAWDALCPEDNYPFVQHAFLYALEKHHCASLKFGWQPCHIALYEKGQLTSAMPMYLKTNSYGEFVFDHTWEAFYAQHGKAYFPKLVTAIPYTPVTGIRLLSSPENEKKACSLLAQAAQDLAKQVGASGWHGLFVTKMQHKILAEQPLMTRFDCQYHWHNQGYQCFDDFLKALKPKKRKNIRQERKAVMAQGVTFRVLSGEQASDKDWQDFTKFYCHTFDEKFGTATFNLDFFQEVAKTMPEQIVLILADKVGQCIAGALCYRSDTTLYGRHWGCIEEVEFLHFETCYYQGIEYCIREGLQVFEPGAQGEYKIARGFMPIRTQSVHWLADKQFVPAIEDFTKREQQGMLDYIASIDSPYHDA